MANVDEQSPDLDAKIPDETWSVSRLNEEIETVLTEHSDRFPTYVVGEVSEISHYSYGTFFTLSDLDAEATISCLAWSHTRDSFEHDLEAGVSAVVRASVDFYPERGNTQLVVRDYWPVGESARVQALEELRATLDAEGLFDAERTQSLPAYPACIGIVTSPSGSAREDVCTAIHDRAPGTRIKLCGATVQGDAAVPSVVGAIQTLDRDPAVEIVIVTRGGGADSDLWCFNAEPLVRAVADCRTPTVAAIGHEDDRTLTDDVADARAMTPTDAGVQSTPDLATVRREVAALEGRIDRAYQTLVDDRIEALQRRVETAHESLQQAAATARAERRATLRRAADLEARIDRSYRRLVADRLDRIDTRLEAALWDLERVAEREAVTADAAQSRLADLEARIDVAYRAHTERELDALETRIDRAYTDVEADAKVQAGTSEARRLRVVVAVLAFVLLAVLGVGALVVLGIV